MSGKKKNYWRCRKQCAEGNNNEETERKKKKRRNKEKVTISCPIGSIAGGRVGTIVRVGGGMCLRVCEACVRAAWCVSLGGGGDKRTGCTALEECVQPGGTSVKLIPPSLPPLHHFLFSPLAFIQSPLRCPFPPCMGQQSHRQQEGEICKLR